MASPHLLRVSEGPEAFAELFHAVRMAGLRAGWLESSDPSPPPDLASAAELGALRAVAVGEARTLVVKPRRGPAVLGDLLREHFRGCALVLLRGPAPAPALSRDGEGWRVHTADGQRHSFTTESLLAALRRPSPWPVP